MMDVGHNVHCIMLSYTVRGFHLVKNYNRWQCISHKLMNIYEVMMQAYIYARCWGSFQLFVEQCWVGQR